MATIILVGTGKQGKRLALNIVKCHRYLWQAGARYNHLVFIEPNATRLAETKQLVAQNSELFSPFGVTYFRSVKKYAEQTGFTDKDVALIAVPNKFHYPVFKECVELGCKSVILEKPVADNFTDIQDVYKLSKKLNINVALNEQYLWSTAFLRAEEFNQKPEKSLLYHFGLISSDYTLDHQSLPDWHTFFPEINNDEDLYVVNAFGVMSKDRRRDVTEGRYTDGLAGHELPHFLAMFDAMWGQPLAFDMMVEDMVLDNQTVIPDHGRGCVILNYESKRRKLPVYLYLSHQEKLERWFELYLNNGMRIKFSFDHGDESSLDHKNVLGVLHTSSCTLYAPNGEELALHQYHDDHLRKAIQDMLLKLWKGEKPISSLENYQTVTELLSSLVNISHWENACSKKGRKALLKSSLKREALYLTFLKHGEYVGEGHAVWRRNNKLIYPTLHL